MALNADAVLRLVAERGEAAVAARLTAEGLAGRGWRMIVVGEASAHGTSGGPETLDVLELDVAGANPLQAWRAGTRLETLAQSEQVALIHADLEAAPLAQRLARRTGRPWLVEVTDDLRPAARRFAIRGGEGWAQAGCVVVPSQDLADRLATAGEVRAERLRVVPPAVDPVRFDPGAVTPDRLNAAREALGPLPDGSVVLVPAPVAAASGHLELLRAVKRLARTDLVVVATGTSSRQDSYRKQLALFARTAGIADQLVVTTAPPDRPAVLALARVVALPATAVGGAAAAAALEAQAMGVPVIVHAVAGLAEALMPAATGWLVEPGDTDGLAEALALALDMPEDVRRRTAARARDFVLDHFTFERRAAVIGDLYRELLRESTT